MGLFGRRKDDDYFPKAIIRLADKAPKEEKPKDTKKLERKEKRLSLREKRFERRQRKIDRAFGKLSGLTAPARRAKRRKETKRRPDILDREWF